MVTYRIMPRRGAFCVQALDGADVKILRIWPTEALAVSHLNTLEEAAEQKEKPTMEIRKPFRAG